MSGDEGGRLIVVFVWCVVGSLARASVTPKESTERKQ